MYLCKGYRVRLFLDIGNVPTMWYFVLFFCFTSALTSLMFIFLPSCSPVHIAKQNTYSYEQTTNEALACLTSCLYSQSSRWLNVSKDILTNSLSRNITT
jgi:maltodextrin utilization protein YvdJ